MSESGESTSCIGGYWDSFVSNMSSFKTFLYDSESGTVMGRDGSSWLKVSIFYLGYYAFLAALFAISITATLSVLDENTPYFQTRLQYPGVTTLPRTGKFDPPSLDIRYNPKEKPTYKAYTDGITKLLEKYQVAAQVNDTLYLDCDPNQPSNYNVFNSVTVAKACRFTTTEFIPACQTSPYGYDSQSPCIFFKLNQVINWKPVPFMSLNDELAQGGGEAGSPSLAQHLTNVKKIYDKQISYVSCNGVTAEDKTILGNKTEYKPLGLESHYFPYIGKKLHPDYIAPMVSIQFQNVKPNTEIRVACKVYARNIIDLLRINVGYVEFKINIGDKVEH